MKTKIFLTAAIAVAAALTASLGVSAQQSRMPMRGGTTAKWALTPFDRSFMIKAAQGGIAEVKTSKLALNKASDSSVRAVARRMVKEHTEANMELKQLAISLGVALPSQTDPLHQAKYRQLARLSGAAFDRAYMKGQVADHNATVALFKREIAQGNRASDIDAFAMKYLPIIQDHTRMVYQVAAGIGISPNHSIYAHRMMRGQMHM